MPLNPNEAPHGMRAVEFDRRRDDCSKCALFEYWGRCDMAFGCQAVDRKDGVSVYFVKKSTGGTISHYDDPGLLAQLANTMHAHKGDRALQGRPDGTVVERIYGTDQIARKGRLVRVSIEWEDDRDTTNHTNRG